MKPFTKNMFEDELAEFYDFMRNFRDYDLEAKFAADVISRSSPNAKNILDIFCGTGQHAIKMAERGYTVTGIDASRDMLNIAQSKTDSAGVLVSYECTDIKGFKPQEQYDASYCLGYTFLYMLTHNDVLDFFHTVSKVLVPGGMLLVDFINGWSFLKESERDKFFYQSEEVQISQFEQLTLNKKERLIHIDYCYLIDRFNGDVKTIYAEENLRIFFDDEVQSLMSMCGFENIRAYSDYSTEENSTRDPHIVIVSGNKK